MNGENMNVSPAEVEKYLKGVSYPASKQDLVSSAQNEGAPDEVVSAIENLPENDFNGPTDVTQALGEIE